MEQHTLVGLDDLKDVTDLLGVEPIDVSKRHDGALVRRQLGDSLPETVERLLPHQELLRRVIVPAPGRLRPHAVGQTRVRARRLVRSFALSSIAALIGADAPFVDFVLTSEQRRTSYALGVGHVGSTKWITSECGAGLVRSCFSRHFLGPTASCGCSFDAW